MNRSQVLQSRASAFNNTARITFIAVLFFIFACLIITKLFVLQVVKHDFFNKLATGQHEIFEELVPQRGKIISFDRNGQSYPVADNKETYLLYAVPALMNSATSTFDELNDILKFEDEEKKRILELLSKKNDPYEPLKHNLTEEQKNLVSALNNEALGFRTETQRIYPEKENFCHLTGFLGFSGDERAGQYGLEEYFEQELKGQPGALKSEKDPAGRLIGVGDFEIEPAENGSEIHLTMDRLVQFKACEALEKAVEGYGAIGGSVIVQNPKTGEILALCSNPIFDPNNYSEVEGIDVYVNEAISSVYEPGSIFKAITMAAAIDSGQLTPEATYVDEGKLIFGEHVITNVDNKAYGEVSMTKVLEESINTGAVFAAQKIGLDEMKRYVEDFGFGSKFGIKLPTEASGDISALNKKADIYLATVSFGQGISVTPLQMVSAFSAIANSGVLMKPYLVKKIVNPDGNQVEFKPEQIRRVISSKTSNILKAMLVSVVKNGHGAAAQVSGYNVGGKTGTAQIPGERGGYINAYNHSFVGFAPISDPEFIVFVKLDKPQVRFAASTAAPTFAEIMRFLLQYYQIPTEY